jgi:hypothetical protein
MRGIRGMTFTGFCALTCAVAIMFAMSADWVRLRTGIWLVTTALGVYGVTLGVGRWIDTQAEHRRRSVTPHGKRSGALRS